MPPLPHRAVELTLIHSDLLCSNDLLIIIISVFWLVSGTNGGYVFEDHGALKILHNKTKGSHMHYRYKLQVNSDIGFFSGTY